MFDLADKRLVWIPVRWKGVKANGDGMAANTTHEIECQVELVDRERMDEIFGTAAKPSTLSELEKFKAVVHDWRKVKAGKVSAPMTDENITAMLRVPMFAAGFDHSYLDAWTGQIEEREKNSDDSSDAGQAGEAGEAPRAAAA